MTLKENILAGGYSANEGHFPTEKELEKIYGLARNTIRSATNKLEKEGYLHRVRGLGVFVSEKISLKRNLIIVVGIAPECNRNIQSVLSGAVTRALKEGANIQAIEDNALEITVEAARLNPGTHTGVLFIRDGKLTPGKLFFAERSGLICVVEGDKAVSDCNHVDVDNKSAMRKVVDHLFDLGHRRFGILSVTGVDHSHYSQRVEHVVSRLAELGVEFDNSLLYEAAYGTEYEESFKSAPSFFLKRSIPPTAIVCVGDPLAARLIQGVREMGVEVPRDISVTGFDDMEICCSLKPSLTSVRLDYFEQGKIAADLVFRMMDDFSNRRVQLKVELPLIPRESTGMAKGNA